MNKLQLKKFEEKVMSIYRKSDVSMWELLASVKPMPGMSLEDCMKVYCSLLNQSDGDRFYRIVEDEREDLVTGVREKIIYNYE